ncbi:fibrinogen C domain-containing protein 1-like [Drosophila busckii]|uniref:fibrinogen C domain-containing protein 1-like n=1 Tax=Drosophila busckii TaxID=30019 RepID=UPI00083E98F5|nr:fibrinogen C domain-containing protein 1-like [Drosophila busckii]
MLADLVKYEAKIKHLEDTIKNLEKQQSAAPPSCVPFGDDIQTIRVPGADAFQVPCDSKLAGNGWIVIQRRIDGSVNFNQTWDEYQHGFGELRGNLWLGLERLHLLTKHQPHELYIQLQDFKNETRYARSL